MWKVEIIYYLQKGLTLWLRALKVFMIAKILWNWVLVNIQDYYLHNDKKIWDGSFSLKVLAYSDASYLITHICERCKDAWFIPWIHAVNGGSFPTP